MAKLISPISRAREMESIDDHLNAIEPTEGVGDGHLNPPVEPDSINSASPPAPPARASDADRDYCLGLAATLGYPEIELGPGVKVPTGEASWTRFVERNDPGTVEEAQTALDVLGQGSQP